MMMVRTAMLTVVLIIVVEKSGESMHYHSHTFYMTTLVGTKWPYLL
jgi:hypothetical protein